MQLVVAIFWTPDLSCPAAFKKLHLSCWFVQCLWPAIFMGWLSAHSQSTMFAPCLHSPVKKHNVHPPACLTARMNILHSPRLKIPSDGTKLIFCTIFRATSHIIGDNAECIPRLWFHSVPNRQDGHAWCSTVVNAFIPGGLEKQWPFLISFLKQGAERKWYRHNWWWGEQGEPLQRSHVQCPDLFFLHNGNLSGARYVDKFCTEDKLISNRTQFVP